MKILRIELQNINSLKSETPILIDFEGEPFNGAGLFGITGTTGAGKTTILDAITIALYNKVPRFNETHYQANVVDVVSRGAAFATSKIWFETNGDRYEAFWRMRLKNANGKKLTTPIEEFQLSCLDTHKILATKKTDYLQQIKTITKLEYRQFLRSVLLAQGEFAAFLSADRKEKGILLEQLTGLDIYRKINDAVNARIGQEEKELAKIKGGLNEADLLSNEMRVENAMKKTKLEGDVVTIQKQSAIAETMLQWFQKQEELANLNLVLQTEKLSFETEKESNRLRLEELQLHRLAAPFLPSLMEWERLEKEKVTLDKELPELRKKLEQQTEDWNNISAKVTESQGKADEASTVETDWQPKLDKVTALDTQMAQLQVKLSELSGQVTAEKNQKDAYNATLDQVRKDLAHKKIEKDAVDLFLADNASVLEIEANLIDWTRSLAARANLSRSVMEHAQTIEGNQVTLSLATASKEKIDSEMLVLRPVVDSLTSNLAKLSNDIEQNPLESLVTKRTQLTDRKAFLLRLLTTSGQAIGLKEHRTAVQNIIHDMERNLAESDKLVQASMQRLEAAGKSKESAETIYRLQSKVINLEAERAELKVDQACPLCGSIHHPYIENYTQPELSESLRELEVCRLEESNAQLSLTEQSVQNATLKANLETQKGDLSKLDTELVDAMALFQSETTEFELYEQQKIQGVLGDVNQILNTVDAQIKTTSGWIESRAGLQKELDEKQQQIQQKELEQASFSTKIEGAKNQIDATNALLSQSSTSLENIESLLITAFAPFALTLPLPHETECFINSLQVRISIYREKLNDQRTLLLDLQALNNQDISLFAQIAASQQRILDLRTRETTTNADFTICNDGRTAILSLNITVEAQRQALKEHVQKAQAETETLKTSLRVLGEGIATTSAEIKGVQNSIATNSNATTSLITEFNERLVGSQWQCRGEVQRALLSEQVRQEYEHCEKVQRDNEISINTRQKSLDDEILVLQERKDFDKSKEEASVWKIELAEQISCHQQTIGQLTESFRKDEEIRSRNQEICIKMDAQKLILQKWTKLYDLLGGTKESFNTYVQRLTLKQLIRQANLHLQKLNNRYSLYMDNKYKEVDELQFGLTDHFQTDEKRFVETSSGGEKFMISLALALGLSDIASRNVRIGSLFIDEGFGSLDSATLETVISTLETLQSQGKMIGVISHVDSLKERIPTQIMVTKKSGGVSTVEVIG